LLFYLKGLTAYRDQEEVQVKNNLSANMVSYLWVINRIRGRKLLKKLVSLLSR